MNQPGPLTFGQLSVWRDIASLPREKWHEPNNSWALPVPAGLTVEDVRSALAALSERHESLRTTLNFGESAPRQVVHPASPPDLTACPARRAGAAARAGPDVSGLKAALVREPFNLGSDFAWRAGVITGGRRPTHLVVALHHLVSDAVAHQVLQRDLGDLLRGGSLRPAVGPRELAEEQHSPRWERRRDAARAYWQRVLADPRPQPPVPVSGAAADQGRAAQATLRSARAHAATGALAAELRISPASVILAAYCDAIFRVTGDERARVRIMSANRFDPKWREVVSSMNQWLPMLVSRPTGESFASFAAGVSSVSLNACRNGMYDVDMAASLAAGALGRPDALDWDYSFNHVPQQPAADGASGGGGREAVTWSEPFSSVGARFYLKVYQRESLVLTLRTAVGGGPAADRAEALLLAIRDVLIEAEAGCRAPARAAQPSQDPERSDREGVRGPCPHHDARVP